MTQEQLIEILTLPIEDQIKALSISSFVVPKWDDLFKQYDPEEHEIVKNPVRYPPIIGESGVGEFPRVTRGLQRLAVNRVSQAQFVTPVDRVYTYDKESESQKKAVDIIEEIYRTQNSIDAENIERAKKVNASCQVANEWRVEPKEENVLNEPTKFRLANSSYSEMDGYKIYPNIDNDKNLIVISFAYKDSANKEYFDIYTAGEKPQFISYTKGANGWQLTELPENPKAVTVFPVVYTYLDNPVWGGTSGTKQVELIEETWSYRALYIKKNSAPIFVQDFGDTSNKAKSTVEESDSDTKKVIPVGKGGSIKAIVWDANPETTKQQIKDMETSFFDDNQIANIAMSVLLNANASAEDKEIMLTDSKAKAVDLGGEWQKLFNIELNEIVIPFAKVMFPSLAKDFDAISVRSIVRPYSIKTDKENAEFVATAGSAMSLETKVKRLGQVTDISSEVEAIEDEQGKNANLL